MAKKSTSKQSQCGPVPEWYREGWKPSYFCIYAKHAAGLLALDDTTLGKLYRAQLSYLLDQASTPPQDGIVALAFNFCKAAMDEDFEHGLYRSWQAYYASHSREGIEAPKEGAKHRTITEDNGRCRELSNINTITQEQHITQEHNNSSKQQKTQETSSTQSSCEHTHETEGDLMDEDNFSSSFSLEDLRAFCKWVLPKHDYDDIDFNAYLRSNSNPTLNNLLDYITTSITQGGVDKETLLSDAKDFAKELRRRQALGLPFAPSDWNEYAMRELFDGLQIPEKDLRRFYDTDCSHDENTALSWICQECYHGTASVEELRRELEDKRKEAALAEIAKVPNKDLPRSVLEAYINLKGYDLCDEDLDRILQADIRSRWTAYVDKCAENADSGEGNLF